MLTCSLNGRHARKVFLLFNLVRKKIACGIRKAGRNRIKKSNYDTTLQRDWVIIREETSNRVKSYYNFLPKLDIDIWRQKLVPLHVMRNCGVLAFSQ